MLISVTLLKIRGIILSNCGVTSSPLRKHVNTFPGQFRLFHKQQRILVDSIEIIDGVITFQRQTSDMINMQAANRLQRALKTSSGLTFGAWQMLPGSNHARTVAHCGFDWICVDCEHGNIDGDIESVARFDQTGAISARYLTLK